MFMFASIVSSSELLASLVSPDGFQSMMDTMNYEIRVEYRSGYQDKILMMAERRVNQIILPRMVRQRGANGSNWKGKETEKREIESQIGRAFRGYIIRVRTKSAKYLLISFTTPSGVIGTRTYQR